MKHHHYLVDNIVATISIALVVLLIRPQQTDGFSNSVPSHVKFGTISSPSSSWSSSVSAPSFIDLTIVRMSRDDDDDDDYTLVPRGGRKRRYSAGGNGENGQREDSSSSRSRFGDDLMGAADRLEATGILDDYYNDEEEYGMFSDVLIPNPILDSIDPDGAAERFPELARDPKFWLEMAFFFTLMNFISFIGPRNPFPDLITDMTNAGLPPPGI